VSSRTLIFVPTYNELENVRELFGQLVALGRDYSLLFLDDNSPDGTGKLLDELARTNGDLHVIHRPGKLGIGSAHRDGIFWAYDHGYARLVTMDCDFTHSPSDVPRLVAHAKGYNVVVGSRYLDEHSLPGWNAFRRTLTGFGHVLTSRVLRIPHDATGAFRVYDLTSIPRGLFTRVRSHGYAFFFESLFLIVRNGFSVGEIPIVLPARTYGHSKMSAREAARSALRIARLYVTARLHPDRVRLAKPFTAIDSDLIDPQGWNEYWETKARASNRLYDLVATAYRGQVIRRGLNRTIRRHFPPGARLLHTGCGSGEVDADIQEEMEITAVDISAAALTLYGRNNPGARSLRHASVFDLPFPDGSFDGAYNLGLVEHFTEAEIRRILSEVNRVLKVGGKAVIFWPHAWASSVLVLSAAHWLLNHVLRKDVRLHPTEISLLRSRRAIEPVLRQAGFNLVEYYFGVRDLFVQAVLVLEKRPVGA
jgi:dolichol-phosphate mannosyltransferase